MANFVQNLYNEKTFIQLTIFSNELYSDFWNKKKLNHINLKLNYTRTLQAYYLV